MFMVDLPAATTCSVDIPASLMGLARPLSPAEVRLCCRCGLAAPFRPRPRSARTLGARHLCFNSDLARLWFATVPRPDACAGSHSRFCLPDPVPTDDPAVQQPWRVLCRVQGSLGDPLAHVTVAGWLATAVGLAVELACVVSSVVARAHPPCKHGDWQERDNRLTPLASRTYDVDEADPCQSPCVSHDNDHTCTSVLQPYDPDSQYKASSRLTCFCLQVRPNSLRWQGGRGAGRLLRPILVAEGVGRALCNPCLGFCWRFPGAQAVHQSVRRPKWRLGVHEFRQRAVHRLR